MKGLFSKIMNKINELPNPTGLRASLTSQNQNQIQTQNTASQNQNQNQSPNNLINNNQINPSINKQNNNDADNANQNNNKKKDSQIVIVNERQVDNKIKGYYYKKHIDDIKKLKVSEPIIYQRQKMKVNFDLDILDYLFNDMTQIFKQKSDVVEENKNELIKKINETYDLVNILSDFNKNSDDSLNKYMKEKKIMDNVEFLEIFIKSLSQEVDDLLSDIAKFESMIKNDSKEENNTK